MKTVKQLNNFMTLNQWNKSNVICLEILRHPSPPEAYLLIERQFREKGIKAYWLTAAVPYIMYMSQNWIIIFPFYR